MPASDLYDLAQDLLLASEGALQSTPRGVPSRSFVGWCDPATDCCDQLTVHISQVSRSENVGPSSGVDRGMLCSSLNVVVMWVTLMRCVPVGELEGDVFVPPPGNAMSVAAYSLLVDVWTLWNRIQSLLRDGTLFGDDDSCRPIELLPAECIAESGICAGWRIGLIVQVNADPSL